MLNLLDYEAAVNGITATTQTSRDYQLQLSLHDDEGAQAIATKQITIKVQNVNEAPFITRHDLSRSVNENSPPGTDIATAYFGHDDEVYMTSPSSLQHQQSLTFTIVAGDPKEDSTFYPAKLSKVTLVTDNVLHRQNCMHGFTLETVPGLPWNGDHSATRRSPYQL